MIFTDKTIHELKTASDIKNALPESSYFFSRKTMKFFGDKMTSFGLRSLNGKRYIYRKPNAMVNVFGTWKQAGKEFSRVWQIIPKHDHVELIPTSEDEKRIFLNSF